MAEPSVAQHEDTARTGDLHRMAATLDGPAPIGSVPPLWHWTMFLDRTPTAELGPDGHPASNEILPELPHPRRMFAGGRLRWEAPLPVDTPIFRRTSAGAFRHKEGRSGPLSFVTVTHQYLVDGAVVLTEDQDLVYRPVAGPRPRPPGQPPARTADDDERSAATATWRATRVADPALLFRFSALTFNAHRIHYDLPYATMEEGHEGLVVHGPLLAIWLLELVRRTSLTQHVLEVRFRALAPAFAGDAVELLGWHDPENDHIELAARCDGRPVMTADVSLAQESAA